MLQSPTLIITVSSPTNSTSTDVIAVASIPAPATTTTLTTAALAASLPAGTTMSTVTVKEERSDDAEIQELAVQMIENQKAAMAKQAAQQQVTANRIPALNQVIPAAVGGQANILNYLTRKPINSLGGTSSIAIPNSQIPTSPTATATALVHNTKSNSNSSSPGDENKTCDEESIKGHFGWATFGKIHIPYITRQLEKYCAVRMVEMKLLNKYLSYLHPDIYSSCTCVRSYYITEGESRLLNEINHKHCDVQFGRELFTVKDLVVRLSDANKFYQFLDICYRKLLTGSKSSSDKCGFIRINKESVVPYTVRNNEQVVPLFYFEGETENLKQKADYLSGWDLAYLKFCCKVQGIRNELFSSESVAVISLSDIKSYFPSGTEFEDYWPNKVVDTNLLVGAKNPAHSSVHWTRQPSAPPPKVMSSGSTAAVPKTAQQQSRKAMNPYHNAAAQSPNTAPRMNGPNTVATPNGYTAATVQAITNGWPLPQGQGPLAPILTHSQTELYRAAQAHNQSANQRAYPSNCNQLGNMIPSPGRQQYNYSNIPMTSINCQQVQQQPPPLVRSQSQNQCHMSTVTTVTAANSAQQHYQQQRIVHNTMPNGRNQANRVHSVAAMRLQRQQVSAAAAAIIDQGRLCVIPEIPAGNLHLPPYKVQKVFVFENTMVPCINMKAYNDSDQLMTLTDFREFFFPNVPLDHCKKLIEALNVEMYRGNRRQIQTLIESGKPYSENIPLIQVRDVIKYMPQIKYMIRNQEQPPNKRTRIS